MVDLFGPDKGNISLPPRLQSPEVLDGQPDDLKRVMILNMQKAVYQVRITDILKRIHRLKTRNSFLEDSLAAEEVNRINIDVETGDQITQLNRQIFTEMEKIMDYQKRIHIVKTWINEEKQTHLDNVEAANRKYAKKRLEITSEINAINSKINMLEEYKVAKTDLRNKLIAGDNLLEQRENEVQQRCEQIKRKFKIGREKLKKELYSRLQGLAGSFQMEVAASLAKPIHQLMRENVFLKNELTDIVRESIPKKEWMKHKKVENDQTICDTRKLKKSTVDSIIRAKIQSCLLPTVEEQHRTVKGQVEQLRRSKNDIKLAEHTYETVKIQTDQMLQKLSQFETHLHRQQSQLGLVNYLRDRSKTEVQRCTDLLYDVKYAVTCALKTTDIGDDISEMGDLQLMSYLLDLLSKVDKQKWFNSTPSLATISPPETVYKIGDLGFDPLHVELPSLGEVSINKNLSELSTLRVQKILGDSFTKSQKALEPETSYLVQNSQVLGEESMSTSSRESTQSFKSESGDEKQGQKLVPVEAVEEEELEAGTKEETEPKIGTDDSTEDGEVKKDEADDTDETEEQVEKADPEIFITE